MAVGNTFGATALSSYGGFWISLAIVLTPGGFEIVSSYETTGSGVNDFNNAFGFFLMGWFIFTTILLLCTLRSTVAFFLLFFFLDLAFLCLGIGHLRASATGVALSGAIKAGGYFGIFAAFMAWYNALAGLADDRYVPVPIHFNRGFRKLTFYFSSVTPSSSFQSLISHGLLRDVNVVARLSAKQSKSPQAQKPFFFLFHIHTYL